MKLKCRAEYIWEISIPLHPGLLIALAVWCKRQERDESKS